MDVIDEKKLAEIDINPALNRIRDEIVKPFLAAVARLEALAERGITVTLGPLK